MKWEPIETAPKDGKPIFLWLKEKIDREYVVAHLCDYLCIGFWNHGRWNAVEAQDFGMMGGELTGWMDDWCPLEVKPEFWAPIVPPHGRKL